MKFFFFLSSPPSPPLCFLPAPLLLFSCSVCSPLAVPAPWWYLARFHAPHLAHANGTLFFTSRVAFVSKKKTRSFRVFPPEN